MGGPGSGPRPGKGHNAKNFPKRNLAKEISGGKFKNLRKAFEYSHTPEGQKVRKYTRIMRKIMLKHTINEAKNFTETLRKERGK